MKFLSLFFILCASSVFANEQKMLLETEKNNVEVYMKTASSIVSVSNIRISRSLWDIESHEVPQGAGSGFVWDNKGHIVTNFHVIQGSDSVVINFEGDQKSYKADVVGVEPIKDIAVLKVREMPSKGINPVSPGVSKGLNVGQKVIAIGNPFGLEYTMTVGVVSSLDRKIKGIGGLTIQGMIQTDASINPGNSGGPLFDSSGQVIGMNTMIYSNSGSSAGIGFAVPIDTIKKIVPQLIEHGEVIRPGLGVTTLSEYQERRFGVDKGIIIRAVDPKGAAGKAGLKGIYRDRYGRYSIGDIILAVDGKDVENIDDIYQIMDFKKIGEKTKVKVLRGDKVETVEVTLQKIDYQ